MAIYSKVIGRQSLESKNIWIAWLLSAKIAMLEGGSGPSPILANFDCL